MASEKVDYVDVVKGLSDGEMSPSDLLVDRLSEDVENRFVEEALKAENGIPEVNRFNGVDVESVPSDAKEEMVGDILGKKEETAKSVDEISEGVFHTVNIGGRSVFSSREKDVQNPKPKGNTDLAEAMVAYLYAGNGKVKTYTAQGCSIEDKGMSVRNDEIRGESIIGPGDAATIRFRDGFFNEITIAAWTRFYTDHDANTQGGTEFLNASIGSGDARIYLRHGHYYGEFTEFSQTNYASHKLKNDQIDEKHEDFKAWTFSCVTITKTETSLFSDMKMSVKKGAWGWSQYTKLPSEYNLHLVPSYKPNPKKDDFEISELMIFDKALSLEDMIRLYDLTKENHKYPWEVPWDLGKADPWWSRIDSEESERTEFDPLLKASIEGGHVVFRSGLVALDECEKKIHKVQEPIHDPRAFPMFKQALDQMVAGNVQIEIGGSGVECEGMKGDDAVIDTTSESFKTAVSEALERIAGEVTFQPDIIKVASEPAEGEEEPTDPNKIEVESPVGSVVLDEKTIRCSFADGSDSAVVRTTVSFVVADGNRSFVQDGASAEILLTIKDTREEREE